VLGAAGVITQLIILRPTLFILAKRRGFHCPGLGFGAFVLAAKVKMVPACAHCCRNKFIAATPPDRWQFQSLSLPSHKIHGLFSLR